MTAFSARAGAVLDDTGTVLHYGDVFREQRALAAGDAVVALTDRRVIEVAGDDRLSWLDSITSQAVSALSPGESTELLILDPHGHIEHAAAVLDDGHSTWLIADAGDAEPLAAWLARMVFRSRVTVAARPELTPVGAVAGGAAERWSQDAAARPCGIPLVWRDPWAAPSGHQYAEVDRHPGAALRWQVALVPADTEPPQAVAGILAAEALRIAAWRPRWQGEVDERSLPHESDWLRTAVHLNKGCYRGQETVAKVHNLGHPPRRIALLHLDGSDNAVPEKGAVVLAGDAEVGVVTSAAQHYEDGPIALAMLSRRAPVDDLIVRVGDVDVAASQQVIVPTDAGATANIPRITRLSRRPLRDA